MEWILASGSPRRRELLGRIIPDFSVQVSQVEEQWDPAWTVQELPKRLALQKALDVSSRNRVAFCCGGQALSSFVQCTEVDFYPLTEEQIQRYLATGEPFDKAGAYGIQGKGGLFVKGIRGDYFNVVGFPLARAAQEMERLLGADGLKE